MLVSLFYLSLRWSAKDNRYATDLVGAPRCWRYISTSLIEAGSYSGPRLTGIHLKKSRNAS